MALSIIPRTDLSSREDKKAPGTYDEEEKRAGIHEGSEAGVGDGVSTGTESTLTSGEVSVGAALLLSSSSHVNSASIHRKSVEEDVVTFISLEGSQGTPVCQHNSVISTGNDRDVYVCLALKAISCETNSPSNLGGGGATGNALVVGGGAGVGTDSVVVGVVAEGVPVAVG
ncbi:hypothetical protein H5410_050986 [Solanum commersonii]|uniref:Uncharacterized protein n=1 Tax=Solanum commersonii TaxID=4109 RepID=A0A9J5WYB4_SOLCO|nr:hypothetical protein H5410_050986 [Solanum commersonii]